LLWRHCEARAIAFYNAYLSSGSALGIYALIFFYHSASPPAQFIQNNYSITLAPRQEMGEKNGTRWGAFAPAFVALLCCKTQVTQADLDAAEELEIE